MVVGIVRRPALRLFRLINDEKIAMIHSKTWARGNHLFKPARQDVEQRNDADADDKIGQTRSG